MSNSKTPKLYHMDDILKTHNSLMESVQESTERLHKNAERLEITVKGNPASLDDLLKHLKISMDSDLLEAKLNDLDKKLKPALLLMDWNMLNKSKKGISITIQGSGPLNEYFNKNVQEEETRFWRNISLQQTLQLIVTLQQRKAQLISFEAQCRNAEIPSSLDPNGLLKNLDTRSGKFFKEKEDALKLHSFTEQLLSTVPNFHRPKEKKDLPEAKTPSPPQKELPKRKSKGTKNADLKKPGDGNKSKNNVDKADSQRGRSKQPNNTKPIGRKGNRSQPPATRNRTAQQKN
jgi:hypothetical protein